MMWVRQHAGFSRLFWAGETAIASLWAQVITGVNILDRFIHFQKNAYNFFISTVCRG